MGNFELVRNLKNNVEAWSEWRRMSPDIEPDLSSADLSGVRLIDADLGSANRSRSQGCNDRSLLLTSDSI